MFVEHKEQGEAVPVKVGTLKLSEAMRIGCAMKPQGRGHYVSEFSSCAIGAAMEGAGMSQSEANSEGIFGLDRKIPGSWEAMSAFSNAHGLPVQTANDYKGWTREQIADALEKLGF